MADSSDNSYHVVTGSGCDATAVLDGLTIHGGNATGSDPDDRRGGGLYINFGSPTLRDCTLINNNAKGNGGAISLVAGSGGRSDSILIHCVLEGNSTTSNGGAVYNYQGCPVLSKCTFKDNSSPQTSIGLGGGIYNALSNLTLTNCAFNGNTAYGGGGMATYGGTLRLVDCLFKDNTAGVDGGGMVNLNLNPIVSNCILWGNRNAGGQDESAQIYNGTDATTTVTFSCVQGWTRALGGLGNIGADPRFADADGRLSPGSPCIDAGDNSAVPADVTADLDGNRRFVDDPATADTGSGTPPIVDMGAFEFGPVSRLLRSPLRISAATANPSELWSPISLTRNDNGQPTIDYQR